MSYRILVTLTLDGRRSDFILSDGDMGDLMKAKDLFIRLAKTMRMPPFGPEDGVKWMEAHYFNIKTTQVGLTMWTKDCARQSWIDTYAERAYVIDMATGEVTSPEWSAIGDSNDAIFAAHVNS